jgi:hypothetical protein
VTGSYELRYEPTYSIKFCRFATSGLSRTELKRVVRYTKVSIKSCRTD